MSDIRQLKAELRINMMRRRESIPARCRFLASKKLATYACSLICIAPKRAVFSSYRAIKSEICTLPLELVLTNLDASIALPVIVREESYIVFKLWEKGCPLSLNKWDLLEPTESALLALPDVIILPLLAFDNAGGRLGYGGGFYDRGLKLLRAKKSVTAVGLAYEEQEVDVVPQESCDQKLDYILTSIGLRAIKGHRTIQCDFSS